METIKPWDSIPYSEEAKAAISKLPVGKSFVVRMKHVTSSLDDKPKVQIEFAEKVDTGRAITAAQMFNADDDRFSSGALRAWETASTPIAEKFYGAIPEGEASVEILKEADPALRMQVTEVTEDQLNDNQRQYPDSYLKRAGRDGNYFYTPDGKRVASLKRMVVVKPGESPVNTYLEGTFRPSETLSDVLGNKSAISSEVMNAGK